MTKFTTLSPHIGDANHLYEVGEPREIEEPGNAQHLFVDRVLGPYNETAEQAWRDSAAARAAAEPATKVDADKAIAALAEGTSTFGAETEALTKERDDARTELTAAQGTIAALTQERDDALNQLHSAIADRDAQRSDLQVAQQAVIDLTTEREALKAAAKPHAAKPK